MFKKAALFLTLMLLLPTLASAYTVMVKVGSGSGSVTLTSPTAGTAITSSGSVSVAGTSSAAFALAPTAGYTVSKILLDNVTVYDKSAVTPLPAGPTSYTVSYNSSKLIRTLTVYYSVLPSYYTVSVSPVPTGGYVLLQKVVNINGTWQASGSSSQTTLGSLKVGDNVRITAVPATDYACSYFAVNGTDTGLATNAVGQSASTIYTVANTPANATVTANFTISGKISGALKSSSTQVAINTPVTLDATGTTANVPFSYGFASNPSAGVTFSTVSNGVMTFTASAAGTYTVTMTATGTPNGSGSASVVIKVLSAADAANLQCTACHATSTPTLVNNYGASTHAANVVTCVNCHVGADTSSGHPGATVTATACENCHSATLSTTTHPVEITASKCIVCHDPHNPAQGIADLGPAPAHPVVTLYTFEEIAMQMNNGNPVPVQVDANGKGMPYSPKQTCGTSGCHVINGINYTYDKISDHAFHSNQGRSEMTDTASGKFDATKNKPWLQSTAMVGKW